tara:strand:+ start:412 stop:753 length:342 start_codon:yes stop_codon:yes gene_type:complete
MKLITKTIERKLKQNYWDNDRKLGNNPVKPIVKFFGGSATWLISEMYPDNDTLFGLCDLGLGCPEYGTVSLSELKSLQIPPFGLGVERDLLFTADKTLSKYAEDAQISGRISA